MMRYSLEHYVIRTVMALGAVAARTSDTGIRDDMRDEVATLMEIWAHDPAQLRRWADRMVRYFDVAATPQSDQPLDAVLAAHAAVLRIQSAIPVERKPVVVQRTAPPARLPAVRRSSGEANQERILAFVREHPDVRTTPLVQGLAGILSPRTIKRCLKDLTESGALVRTKADGGVSYRAER